MPNFKEIPHINTEKDKSTAEKPVHVEKIEPYPKEEEKTLSPEQIQERAQRRLERIKALRSGLRKLSEKMPVDINKEDKNAIEDMARGSADILGRCYKEGFGIFPSSNPEESFYNTIWSRDLAHAGGNFFVKNGEDAVLQSLKTVFSFQKPDGSLPYRVEKKRYLLEHTEGSVWH